MQKPDKYDGMRTYRAFYEVVDPENYGVHVPTQEELDVLRKELERNGMLREAKNHSFERELSLTAEERAERSRSLSEFRRNRKI